MAASTKLRLRHHLLAWTPSQFTLTCYLLCVVVQYSITDHNFDYSAPFAPIAYAFITAFVYLTVSFAFAPVVLTGLLHLLTSARVKSKKLNRTEPVNPTPEQRRGALMSLESLGLSIPALIPALIVVPLIIPAAALLHISERPGSVISWPAIISGTLCTFGNLARNGALNMCYGLILFGASPIAPILIMYHQQRVIRVLNYAALACTFLSAYGMSLKALTHLGLDKHWQYPPGLLAHLRWQATEVVSPASCWLGEVVFFCQLFYLLTSMTANYLFRRATVVEPTLFEAFDNPSSSYSSLMTKFTQPLVLPATLSFIGLLLQNGDNELRRWTVLFSVYTGLGVGLFALNLALYCVMIGNTATAASPTAVLDTLAVRAALYLWTANNSTDEHESIWTMLELILRALTDIGVASDENVQEPNAVKPKTESKL